MLTKTMTDRQRCWLDHIQDTAVFEGATADYARSHHLKIHDIYNWKSKLLKLKLYQPFKSVAASNFVPVEPSSPMASLKPHKQLPADRCGSTVTLANGSRIDFYGELSTGVIRSIMTSVSSAH